MPMRYFSEKIKERCNAALKLTSVSFNGATIKRYVSETGGLITSAPRLTQPLGWI